MQEIKMWTDGVPVEAKAMQQLRNIAGLPIVAGHVAVMRSCCIASASTGTPSVHILISCMMNSPCC